MATISELTKGTRLYCPTEPTWPTFMVHAVHTENLPLIAGHPIPPYVSGEFSDEPGKFASLNLANILSGQWEDSGV